MPRKPLRVAMVSNARSDYSTMYPIFKEAVRDTEIDARIFIGGMHLRPQFGNTIEQVIGDGFQVDEKLDYFIDESDTRAGLGLSLGKATQQFTTALGKHEPDIVLVSGDRIENLGLFSATTALGIPVAHLCGGDITEGAFDDSVRHAMTKLSHLHFPSMKKHAERIIQMGEEPWRVCITGDAALDSLKEFRPLSRLDLQDQLGVPERSNVILSTFHPVTLGDDDFVQHFDNMLAALYEKDAFLVFTYPNIDPGYKHLISKLNEFSSRRKNLTLVESCTRDQYYSLLHYCDFVIGNSSSGLWEGPTLKTKCINIGSRQAGRERAGNVIDVSGNSISEIDNAIEKSYSKEFSTLLESVTNPYGDGTASAKIFERLKSTPIDTRLMTKKFYEISK